MPGGANALEVKGGAHVIMWSGKLGLCRSEYGLASGSLPKRGGDCHLGPTPHTIDIILSKGAGRGGNMRHSVPLPVSRPQDFLILIAAAGSQRRVSAGRHG